MRIGDAATPHINDTAIPFANDAAVPFINDAATPHIDDTLTTPRINSTSTTRTSDASTTRTDDTPRTRTNGVSITHTNNTSMMLPSTSTMLLNDKEALSPGRSPPERRNTTLDAQPSTEPPSECPNPPREPVQLPPIKHNTFRSWLGSLFHKSAQAFGVRTKGAGGTTTNLLPTQSGGRGRKDKRKGTKRT